MDYMKRALALAAQGHPNVYPNPLVGAVIVKEGRVIAEGYHQAYGGPHAEIHALQNATESVVDATMYVTLEPCSHFGKTPPCAHAIIAAGINKVVVASVDPNPLVSGQGIALLKEAGISVEMSGDDTAQQALNHRFMTVMKQQRPFVILKSAMSADGKIATVTGESKYITGPAAREAVHRTRARVKAVLVGSQTAQCDNPSLNVRYFEPDEQPTRIVIDAQAECSLNLTLFRSAQTQPTFWVVGDHITASKRDEAQRLGVHVLALPLQDGHTDWGRLGQELIKLGLDAILIEAGSQLAFHLLRIGWFDQWHCYIAPIILGGQSAHSVVGGTGIESINEAVSLRCIEVKNYGDDLRITYQKKDDVYVYRDY